MHVVGIVGMIVLLVAVEVAIHYQATLMPFVVHYLLQALGR